jgi:hypothetical protein
MGINAPAFGTTQAARKGFVSYAHTNAALASQFLGLVADEMPVVTACRGLSADMQAWWDYQIQIGKGPWRQQIVDAIATAEFGVFLLSRELCGSPFIEVVEVPPFLRDPAKKVFVVGLCEVDLQNENTLGLADEQVHLLRGPNEARGRWFEPLGAPNRKLFARSFCELFIEGMSE